MKLCDNLILTDADGVLLYWEYAFIRWMQKQGFEYNEIATYDIGKSFGLDPKEEGEYINRFNSSKYFEKIPPMRDAIHYVRKLHEEYGYMFHVITASSEDEEVIDRRKYNLYHLFGRSPFEEITCLPLGCGKRDALREYKDSGCVWVEDSPNHAETGLDLGLNVYLMRHNYNDHVEEQFEKEGVNIVHSWKDVYESLT